MENEAALLLLSDHLAELDALPGRQKYETAATNLLAGNVFDWGAKEAAALMQIPGFGFQQALAHLQSIVPKNNLNHLGFYFIIFNYNFFFFFVLLFLIIKRKTLVYRSCGRLACSA
jgi:type II pantothenate kinase